jgi:hypothetical protein
MSAVSSPRPLSLSQSLETAPLMKGSPVLSRLGVASELLDPINNS